MVFIQRLEAISSSQTHVFKRFTLYKLPEEKNMKVVFLGDSITDAGRNTTNGSMVSIGQSYPLILDAKLSVSEPGKYEFINTGVSGSCIVDSVSVP